MESFIGQVFIGLVVTYISWLIVSWWKALRRAVIRNKEQRQSEDWAYLLSHPSTTNIDHHFWTDVRKPPKLDLGDDLKL